jgi:MiaB/RimO family radical SAM methylthiotransferase
MFRRITRSLSSRVRSRLPSTGPDLKDFLQKSQSGIEGSQESLAKASDGQLKYFIETYGCQMNVSDSEIVRAILMKNGHVGAASVDEADLILINTCAIRENAEAKIWNRLAYFRSIRREKRLANVRARKKEGLTKKDLKLERATPHVGVLGCMAERLKERLLEEESVDFVVGPDAYRDLGRLVDTVSSTGQKEANTQLSLEETYADIAPVRETDAASAFVSIMRGCNNMCSYCIVPFTRGRERSRDLESIKAEVGELISQGVREVCLLGQNVNGYHDTSQESALKYPHKDKYQAADGFDNLYKGKTKDKPGARFADLLAELADMHPELRIRFTSPHPKDFPDEVLTLIAERHNLCSSLHLPAQSGSTSMLRRMRRGYSREAYLSLANKARAIIPGVTISTDMIAGFCGETEEEHRDTLSLMEHMQYDQAFLFAYSLRDKTHADRNLEDDVPEEVKLRRLQEVIEVYRRRLLENAQKELHQQHLVLIEGPSTKSTRDAPYWTGRTDGNKRVVFPAHTPMWEDHRSQKAVQGSALIRELVDRTASEVRHAAEAALDTEEEGEGSVAVKRPYALFMNVAADMLRKEKGHDADADADADAGLRDIGVGPGTYVVVQVVEASGPTLKAVAVAPSTLHGWSHGPRA